jgi:hypothetical protein
MSNIPFADLTIRSNITNDDFFVTNRENEEISPEGIIPFSLIKNNLYKDLIVKNNIYNVTENVDVITYNNILSVKNSDGSLIGFKDFLKETYGIFQISCKKSNDTNIENSVVGLFDLIWVPNNINLSNLIILENQTIYIANDPEDDTKNNICIFLKPFIPESFGSFRINVRFTQEVPTAKCLIDCDFWLIETE